jgi:hypothetical protein
MRTNKTPLRVELTASERSILEHLYGAASDLYDVASALHGAASALTGVVCVLIGMDGTPAGVDVGLKWTVAGVKASDGAMKSP